MTIITSLLPDEMCCVECVDIKMQAGFDDLYMMWHCTAFEEIPVMSTPL